MKPSMDWQALLTINLTWELLAIAIVLPVLAIGMLCCLKSASARMRHASAVITSIVLLIFPLALLGVPKWEIAVLKGNQIPSPTEDRQLEVSEADRIDSADYLLNEIAPTREKGDRIGDLLIGSESFFSGQQLEVNQTKQGDGEELSNDLVFQIIPAQNGSPNQTPPMLDDIIQLESVVPPMVDDDVFLYSSTATPFQSIWQRAGWLAECGSKWLPALWLAGILLGWIWWWIAWLALKRKLRSFRVVPTSTFGQSNTHWNLGEHFARVLNRSTIRFAPTNTMPFVCGLWNSTIVLPNHFDQWPVDQQRSVLLHELAHVARRDLLTDGVARLANGIWWWNPAVWVLRRWQERECESACDETVMEIGQQPEIYAQHLLSIVRSSRAGLEDKTESSMAAGAIGMATHGQLADRVQQILAYHPNNRRGIQLTRVYSIGMPIMVLLALIVRLVPIEIQEGIAAEITHSTAVPDSSLEAELHPSGFQSSITHRNHRVETENDFVPTTTTFDDDFLAIVDRFLSTPNVTTSDMSKRASFASKMKKMDQADELLMKLESQNPESKFYWERLAFAQHMFGDPTRAIDSYQKGLQRNPKNLPLRLLCLRCQLTVESDVNSVIGNHLPHVADEDLEEFGLNVLAFLEVAKLDYLQRMDGLSALFDHAESKGATSVRKMDWLVDAFRILILDYDARPNQSNLTTDIFTPSPESAARRRLHDRWVAITEKIADRGQLAFSAWLALRQFEGDIPVDIALSKAENSLLTPQTAADRIANPIHDYNSDQQNRRVVAQNFNHSTSSYYSIKYIRPLLPDRYPLDYLARHYGRQEGADAVARANEKANKIVVELKGQERFSEAEQFEIRYRLYRIDESAFAQEVTALLTDRPANGAKELIPTLEWVIDAWSARQMELDLAPQLAGSIGRVWQSELLDSEELIELLWLYAKYCLQTSQQGQTGDYRLAENAIRELARAIMGPDEMQEQIIDRHLEVVAMPYAGREQAKGEKNLQRHQTYVLFLQILTNLHAQQDISNRFGIGLALFLSHEIDRCHALRLTSPFVADSEGRASSMRNFKGLVITQYSVYPIFTANNYQTINAISAMIRRDSDPQKVIDLLEQTPYLKSIDHFDSGLTIWMNILRSFSQGGFANRGALIKLIEQRKEQTFGTRLVALMLRQSGGRLPSRIDFYNLIQEEIQLFGKLPANRQRKIASFMDGMTADSWLQGQGGQNTSRLPWQSSESDHPVGKLITEARKEEISGVFDRLMQAKNFDDMEIQLGTTGHWVRRNLFALADQEPQKFVTALVQLSKLMQGGTRQVPGGIGAPFPAGDRIYGIEQTHTFREIFFLLGQEIGGAKAFGIFSGFVEHPDMQWLDSINFFYHEPFVANLKTVLDADAEGVLPTRLLPSRMAKISNDLTEAFKQTPSPLLLVLFHYSLAEREIGEINLVKDWAQLAQQPGQPKVGVARMWAMATELHLVKSRLEPTAPRLAQPNAFQQEWMQWISDPELHLSVRWALAVTVFLNDPTLPIAQAKQCLTVLEEVIEKENIENSHWISQTLSVLVSVNDDHEFEYMSSSLAKTLVQNWESGKPYNLITYDVFRFLYRLGKKDVIGRLIRGPARNSLNIHSEALLIELGYGEFLIPESIENPHEKLLRGQLANYPVQRPTNRWTVFDLEHYFRFFKTGRLRNSNWPTHPFNSILESQLPEYLNRIDDLGLRFAMEVYYCSLLDSGDSEKQPKTNRTERLKKLAHRYLELPTDTFTDRIEQGLALVLMVNEPDCRPIIMPAVEQFVAELPPEQTWTKFNQYYYLLSAAAVGGLQQGNPQPFQRMVRHVQAGFSARYSGPFDRDLDLMIIYFLESLEPVESQVPGETWDAINDGLSNLGNLIENSLRKDSRGLQLYEAFLLGKR